MPVRKERQAAQALDEAAGIDRVGIVELRCRHETVGQALPESRTMVSIEEVLDFEDDAGSEDLLERSTLLV